MEQTYTQDLEFIERCAHEKEDENERFRAFLKTQDGEHLDEHVRSLDRLVSDAIDCTRCGNCCRSLMINVEPAEAGRLSDHLGMTMHAFTAKYIERSVGGQMIINTIPCHFLQENRCSIYDQRFEECRQFPHLHRPGFARRLFSTFMHYGRCPIVFNIVETLKADLSFSSGSLPAESAVAG